MKISELIAELQKLDPEIEIKGELLIRTWEVEDHFESYDIIFEDPIDD